jgi:hypothetical protein
LLIKLNDQLEQNLINDIEIQAKLDRVKEIIENIEHNAKILNNLAQNNENDNSILNYRK